MIANDAPILSQSVRWGENYVSRALNIKSAGIIPAGIYHGFNVRPGGDMAVLIEHDEDYPRSVAVIERDGYSLTVIMDDPGTIRIPAPGEWFICIEALYNPTKQGYQRIVAREKVEAHHVVLAAVSVADSVTNITPAMIDYGPRQFLAQITDIIDGYNLQLAQNAASIIGFSDRLTKDKLERIEKDNDWLTELMFLKERGAAQKEQSDFQSIHHISVLAALSDRITRETLTRFEQTNELYTESALAKDREAMRNKRESFNATNAIKMLDRITNLELAFYSGNSPLTLMQAASASLLPEGYETYGGSTVAPLSIVRPGDIPPLGAAIVLKLERA